MEVILAVAKTCLHCPLLEKELKGLGVPYCVKYYEAHPKMTEKYGLKRSPVVIEEDAVVFNNMPSPFRSGAIFQGEKEDRRGPSRIVILRASCKRLHIQGEMHG